QVSGGYTARVTPVPIPNTEVKPRWADDTARVTAWERRSLPGLNSKKPQVSVGTWGFLELNPGSDIRSHAVTRAVSSAQRGLTSVFGMGFNSKKPQVPTDTWGF